MHGVHIVFVNINDEKKQPLHYCIALCTYLRQKQPYDAH